MRILLLTLCCALACLSTTAQAPADRWALRADIYHQNWIGDLSIGYLGTYDEVRIRPGFRLGAERTWVNHPRSRFYQDLLIGYYHNTYEERSLTLGSDLGYEFTVWKQLRVAPWLGLHYHLAKPSDIRYRYDGVKWVQTKNTDPAVSRLQIPVGMNLGWRFMPDRAHPLDVFVNGNISVVGPWEPGTLPVLAYQALGIGLRLGI